jgi:3-deoxy-D-manno-octulosonic-acid transferase
MLLRERLYQATLSGARAVLRDGWGHGPLGHALRTRAAALPTFQAWAHTERDPARPLVLLHAPSVGEGLMAQAIVSAARALEPRLQVAFTFFSPSAERTAQRIGADVAAYLPWDVARDIDTLLAALRPSAVGFVRSEIWPVLGARAAAGGARVLLLNAVLAAGSSRLRPHARFLLGPAYRRLDGIGAVARADADRFLRLGIAAERVQVTGDARFDQVLARLAALDRDGPLLRLLRSDRRTVVAGSTWPADETLLLAAVAALPAGTRPRVLLAPHQPTPAHVQGALATAQRHALPAQLLASVERGDGQEADVVIVDRVGVLADLYALADVAYVGGGFGGQGLHSVVEPAALGVPVLYGPRHGSAREADELAHAGGGFVVSAATVRAELARLLHDEHARGAAGAAAAGYVERRRGGAAANAALLLAGVRTAPR